MGQRKSYTACVRETEMEAATDEDVDVTDKTYIPQISDFGVVVVPTGPATGSSRRSRL